MPNDPFKIKRDSLPLEEKISEEFKNLFGENAVDVTKSLGKLIANDNRGAILEASLDSVPLPIAFWSDDKLILVNRAFCTLTGYSSVELISHSWKEFIVEEDRDEGLELVEENKSNNNIVINYNNRWYHKDGHILEMNWWCGEVSKEAPYALAICLPKNLDKWSDEIYEDHKSYKKAVNIIE